MTQADRMGLEVFVKRINPSFFRDEKLILSLLDDRIEQEDEEDFLEIIDNPGLFVEEAILEGMGND